MLLAGFYLNGMKPVYQMGFEHRFGYRAQLLRSMVFCKGAKGKWTKSSMKYFSNFSISCRRGSLWPGFPVSRLLDRFAIACAGLWRELFTRAPFLIGLLIGQSHKQGD
jgi:hypothetical protein